MFQRITPHLYILSALFLLLAALACGLPVAVPSPTDTAAAPASTSTPAFAAVASPAIQKFKMLDASNGWAVSDNNILRTIDGGATWLDVTPAGLAGVNYPAAFFMDVGNAWIVISAADYTSGTLYRTQDGGSHWSSVSVPFAGGDLKFLDANNGFVLADLGAAAGSEAVAVFQIGDGGQTWTQNYTNAPNASGAGNSLPFGGDKSGMTFRDTSHGWVAGETPVDNFVYLYASADSGHTWAVQNVVLPPAESTMFGTDAPIFFDQSNGLLPVNSFAGDASNRLFFATSDGGSTWMPTSTVQGGRLYSVISRQEAVVWDGGPTLHATHDGMLNWVEVHPNINVTDTISGMQFVDAGTGWVLTMDANSHVTLYKTTDGGATWTAIP